MPDIPLHRYARVALTHWSAASSAGDAAATWQAWVRQQDFLQHDGAWGFIGPRPQGHPADLLAAAHALALEPWRRIAELPGRPAWSISSSKGSLDALQTPSRLLAGLPGLLGPDLGQRLQVPGWIPCPVAAACATGLYGVLAVADAIERGHCGHGLVGSIDCNLSALVLAGFQALGVSCGHNRPQSRISDPRARCHGFAPAEGLAFAALSGTGPWRLMAGIRISDGLSATRAADPAVLAACLRQLWDHLGRPQAILCHATGTDAGDAYERAALEMGPWRSVPRIAYKTRIGHTLGASGLVELAATCCSTMDGFWQLSLGFGGHIALVALQRSGNPLPL